MRYVIKAWRYDENDLAPLCRSAERRERTNWKYDTNEPDMRVEILMSDGQFKKSDFCFDDLLDHHKKCRGKNASGQTRWDLIPMSEGLWIWEGFHVEEPDDGGERWCGDYWIGSLTKLSGNALWAFMEDRLDLDLDEMILRESQQMHIPL